MKCLVSLRIFNGFMQTDEDLHALLIVVGMEGLTGRGLVTPESIKKEISSPLQSSKTRMTGTASDLKHDTTAIMNEVEGGVLRELNGLKKERRSLVKKNKELRLQLEQMGLMKNGRFLDEEELQSGAANDANASFEEKMEVKVEQYSF